MGMTIAEKIIARAAGVDQVRAGDIHTVTLDRMMSNDGTTHLTVDMYHSKLKNPGLRILAKWYLLWITTYPLTVPKQQHPRRKCGILQESMELISGRERAFAIRL